MSAEDRARLRALARRHGVQTSYTSWDGRRVTAGDATLRGVLEALGVDASTPSAVARELRRPVDRMVEPVVVAWDGRLDDVPLRARGAVGRRATVRIEPVDADGPAIDARPAIDDGRLGLRAAAPSRLAEGYHRMDVRVGRREATVTVLAAPSRAPRPTDRAWGVFAPLHGLRGDDDWGVGSFTDLERALAWVRSRGGTVVATLPMLAAFLDEPFEPSPYAPASRLFWNELFVDVTAAPGLAETPEARRLSEDVGVRREIDELRAGDLVDHRRAMALKRRILEPLAERALRDGGSRELSEWLHAREPVRDYARFRAEVERTRAWWGSWAGPARGGRLDGDPLDDPRGRYHVYVQWLADRQIRAIGASDGGGLFLDLPVGVHGAGYDAWRHRHAFADGASTGAPPDRFFRGGQDWGSAPLHPERIRDEGYAYPIACIRHLLRSAAMLRVDHVMGFHRLYWVTPEQGPTEGAYVRYRANEWYAILTLEATRADAVVVGEDLGTVPSEVRRAMARHEVLRSYVVPFEMRPAEEPFLRDPPARSLACVNTHDMVPWAAFASADDVALAVELGMIDAAEARRARRERDHVLAALRRFLRERGLRPRPGDRGVLEATLAFLAGSEAAVVMVSLDDLVGERRPQNVPGTSGGENWRVRTRPTLAEIAARSDVDALLRRVAEARSRPLDTRAEAGAA